LFAGAVIPQKSKKRWFDRLNLPHGRHEKAENNQTGAVQVQPPAPDLQTNSRKPRSFLPGWLAGVN
jgi:hypothetical protein